MTRKIVITGVASGIGAATAAMLRRDGDFVIGVDINKPSAGAVDQFLSMDQSDVASIEEAVTQIPDDLDGLVNCAGVPPAAQFSPALVLRTNFYGLRYFTRKVLKKIRRGGAIVNLTSGTGMGWRQNIALLQEALAIENRQEVADLVARHQIHNQGVSNISAYPLSKQLLIVWTAAAYPIWQETGVRMNAIAPGAVDTPILDDFLSAFGAESAERIRAIGTASADAIASVARLLLDPHFEWINATTIPLERGAITYGGLSKLGLG